MVTINYKPAELPCKVRVHTPLPTSILGQLKPRRTVVATVRRGTTLDGVTYDEMHADVQRVVASVAQKFTDQTTPHLHFDELIGDGLAKVASVVDKGYLERNSRADFFKVVKTSVNNCVMSKVQKYRFTQKRTGVKPPPRNQELDLSNHDEPSYHKNVELSLDDPDHNLQVADEAAANDDIQEIVEEWEALLTPLELIVFRQLAEPNALALCLAQMASYHGSKPGKLAIKIKHEHLAEGLGMPLQLFSETVLSVEAKIKKHRAMTDTERQDQVRRNATLSTLCQIFGLQIPPNTDDIVVRRMLTLAARDQHHKVNGEVSDLLAVVGAKPPEVLIQDKLKCYGVLYQKNHRICMQCGLRQSCSVEAANLGLTKIALSPKLLGARQPRTPVVMATVARLEPESAPSVASDDEMEILTYLDETLERKEWRDVIYYAHKGSNGNKRNLVFSLGSSPTPLNLRFVNPSEDLRKKLKSSKRGNYTLPENLKLAEIISLIDQHTKEAFVANG